MKHFTPLEIESFSTEQLLELLDRKNTNRVPKVPQKVEEQIIEVLHKRHGLDNYIKYWLGC